MMRTLLACLLGSVALTAPAAAEVRAVLVGVGDYLTLDADLKGPANDVRLMGLLWGGSTNSFVFSPLGGVEKDLGTLDVPTAPT